MTLAFLDTSYAPGCFRTANGGALRRSTSAAWYQGETVPHEPVSTGALQTGSALDAAEQQLEIAQFGGPAIRFAALLEQRRAIYGLPVIDGRDIPDWLAHSSTRLDPSSGGTVRVALFNPAGSLAMVRSAAPLPCSKAAKFETVLPARRCGEELPEVAAFSIAAQMGDVVWGLHPVAIEQRGGMPDGMLFAAFTRSFTSSSVEAVPWADLGAASTIRCPSFDALALARRRQAEVPPLAELTEPRRRPVVRWAHRNLVKPLLASRRQLWHFIEQQCAGARTVLDASAGDDPLAQRLARAGHDLVVANDIAFDALVPASRVPTGSPPSNLILSNRPIEHLEMGIRFDVAVLKNTLHHFSSARETCASLRALACFAKRLVIVEVENPLNDRRGKAWNWYYEHVLGDGQEEHRYYNAVTFRQLLRGQFRGGRIQCSSLRTERGNYLLAVVDL